MSSDPNMASQLSRAIDTFNSTGQPYGMRNSCDLCYTSKLRCSGEKPACARCQKGKVVCTYGPTKRPGRPRKAGAKSYADNARANAAFRPAFSSVAATTGPTQASLLSWSPATQRISNPGSDEQVLLDVDMQCAVDGMGEGFELDWPDNVTSVRAMGTDALNDHPAGPISNVTSTGHPPLPAASQPPVSLLDEDWDVSRSILETGHTISPATSCIWANKETSPQASEANGSTGEASLSRLQDSTGFSAWHNSLNQWISARRCFAPTGVDAASMEPDALCLCPTALMTLQLHRKSISKGQAKCPLEASLHLQRLLRWTWDLHKDCPWCGEDDVIKFFVAAIADELAGAYRKIVTADETRQCGHQPSSGTEHAAKRRAVSFAEYAGDGHILSAQRLKAAPEATCWFTGQAALKLGHKPIEGVAKAAFLRRVMSLRLQELSLLARELSPDTKRADLNGSSLVQPLRLLTLGVLEDVSVIKGML